MQKCSFSTGMGGLGDTVQYGHTKMPNVEELSNRGMWMNRTNTTRFPAHVRQHAGCLAASSASSISRVRDMPHVMVLLVLTFALSSALYACKLWGPAKIWDPVMQQLSPCGKSSLQSDLL
jgi:hypothetical protein